MQTFNIQSNLSCETTSLLDILVFSNKLVVQGSFHCFPFTDTSQKYGTNCIRNSRKYISTSGPKLSAGVCPSPSTAFGEVLYVYVCVCVCVKMFSEPFYNPIKIEVETILGPH